MSSVAGKILEKLSHLIVKNNNYLNIVSTQLKDYSKHNID